MQVFISTFGVGYNSVDNESGRVELVGAARYSWVDVEEKRGLRHNGVILQTSRQVMVPVSDDLWGGIVGVRGEIKLNSNGYLPYYADVAAGASQSTSQAMAQGEKH